MIEKRRLKNVVIFIQTYLNMLVNIRNIRNIRNIQILILSRKMHSLDISYFQKIEIET